jgi:hypothetical protein
MVRKQILLGNTCMLWNGIKKPEEELPDKFAAFIAHNGKIMVTATNKLFMNTRSIKDCLKSLKPKNSEGFDRIPQKIGADGVEILINSLTKL